MSQTQTSKCSGELMISIFESIFDNLEDFFNCVALDATDSILLPFVIPVFERFKIELNTIEWTPAQVGILSTIINRFIGRLTRMNLTKYERELKKTKVTIPDWLGENKVTERAPILQGRKDSRIRFIKSFISKENISSLVNSIGSLIFW